jgi:hypothetical protein
MLWIYSSYGNLVMIFFSLDGWFFSLDIGNPLFYSKDAKAQAAIQINSTKGIFHPTKVGSVRRKKKQGRKPRWPAHPTGLCLGGAA